MWYLYALIIWLFSLALIDQAKKYVPRIAIVFGYTGMMLVSGYMHLPLGLTRVVVFYLFFVTGYLYKRELLQWMTEKRNTACNLTLFIVLAAFFVVIGMAAENVNANILWEYLSYSEGGYTLRERLIFCVAAITICLMICCISTSYKSSFLIELGKNTMPIYIFHAFFVKGFDRFEANINVQRNVLYLLGRMATAVIVIFFLQSEPIRKITGKIWSIPINRKGKKRDWT